MKTGSLTTSQLFSLALAESRGAWRRFIFFIVCIAVGVGAVMTVKSFSTLLNDAIQGESKGLLAADIEIKGSWEQTPADVAFQQTALPEGTRFQSVRELHAMAQYPLPGGGDKGDKASLLVELKSVPAQAPFYPMYGMIELNPPRPLNALLAESGAVVDPAFLWRTKLEVGDSFQLGKTEVRINGTVVKEPDRISRAFSIGPRVFVSHTVLKEADLVRTGSRIRHRTLIGLPDTIELEKALVLLERGLTDKTASLRTYKDMESSLNKSIERMGQYLGAVGVIALLMGGIGVAMIIRTFMAQKLDTIAILSCLGASSRTLLKIYLLQSILLGLLGSVLGVVLGYGLQFTLPSKLSGLLNLDLEPVFYWTPALHSLALGIVTTLLFSFWPLIRAAKTKPLRLFRRNFEEEELSSGTRWERRIVGAVSILVMTGIVIGQAGSVQRGLVFLLALGVSALLLSGLASLFLKALKKLPPPGQMTRRYGLANLHRPNNQTRSIVTCLGMGIMLVLTVRLVQTDMIAMLKENTEINPPNYFFIDIQSDQTETFLKTLDRVAPAAERTLTPLIRSRFHGIDGRLAKNWHYENRRKEEWFINREFVTTRMEGGDLPKDNEIVQGTWWKKADGSIPQISLEEDAAKRLGAKIGSQLTMDIQGIPVTAPVTSIRKVNWRNMRTNFYMIFSPGALEGAPVTYVSTVHVPKDKELPLQHAVVNALPNITALSTRDIIDTIENVVEKLKTLVDFMSAFTITAGLIILSGSVASTKYRRLKESAVLKILGARRKKVASILGVEYATLGVIASLVGVGLSAALSWTVMKYLVKAPWHLQPGIMLWTLALAVLLTTMTGIFSSLDVLKNKPLKTLRQID
ncbi:ABC transporter permease [Candidatus Nitromaritima sp. SCGC AAA799-C22]|nr:ABC transporter permease [Candidatus Nitromaritima sp. SCGC AAA799-C22]